MCCLRLLLLDAAAAAAAAAAAGGAALACALRPAPPAPVRCSVRAPATAAENALPSPEVAMTVGTVLGAVLLRLLLMAGWRRMARRLIVTSGS